MQAVHERCAGLDIHKKTVVACVLTGSGRSIRTYGTMTRQLEALADWLAAEQVSHVAMESTGVYWKPVYNLLENRGLELLVVNARHIKNVPGRKTDVKDAEWIADLLRHGLLRASFIPGRDERELRELVRYRRTVIEQRAHDVQRIQKVLEGANIKLSDVASDTMGASGRAMLEPLAHPSAHRLLGQDLAWQPRERRQTLLGPDRHGQSLAARHPGRGGSQRQPRSPQLLRRPLPPPQSAPRQEARHGGGRPQPLGGHLPHDQRRHLASRPGLRPLRAPGPGADRPACGPPPGAARLPGHHPGGGTCGLNLLRAVSSPGPTPGSIFLVKGETSHVRKKSSGSFEEWPGYLLSVQLTMAEAAVKDADQAVGEGAQRLLMA